MLNQKLSPIALAVALLVAPAVASACGDDGSCVNGGKRAPTADEQIKETIVEPVRLVNCDSGDCNKEKVAPTEDERVEPVKVVDYGGSGDCNKEKLSPTLDDHLKATGQGDVKVTNECETGCVKEKVAPTDDERIEPVKLACSVDGNCVNGGKRATTVDELINATIAEPVKVAECEAGCNKEKVAPTEDERVEPVKVADCDNGCDKQKLSPTLDDHLKATGQGYVKVAGCANGDCNKEKVAPTDDERIEPMKVACDLGCRDDGGTSSGGGKPLRPDDAEIVSPAWCRSCG